MAPAPPTKLSGFNVLLLEYPKTDKRTTHYLYLREHESHTSTDELPLGRTIFMVNLPPDATERELSLLFRPAGTIESVRFADDRPELPELLDTLADDESDDEDEERPPAPSPFAPTSIRTLRRSGHTAHIVFMDASSVARALNMTGGKWPAAPDHAPFGLQHYLSQHAAIRPSIAAVRAYAEAEMARFDWAEARVKRRQRKNQGEYKKGEAIVDEDGFTLVTRGGAYGQTLGGGARVASKAFELQQKSVAGAQSEGKRNRKKKDKQKEGFYAFQAHEKKRKELIDLKQKFEQDKAHIESHRATKRSRASL